MAGDPRAALRRPLAQPADRDPGARDRVPRARRALHARHRLRAGDIRSRVERHLARARDELPRDRPRHRAALMALPRLELDFVARRRASPWVGRVLFAVATTVSVDMALQYHDLAEVISSGQKDLARPG